MDETSTELVDVQSRKVLFSWADYTLFAITLIASTSISIYFGCFEKKKLDVKKYLTGGRNLKTLPVALSIVSCQISSITLLALPADVYKYGATFFLTPLSMLIVCLAMIYIYLPVFYDLQLTTIYEYLELRFDSKTRLLGSFLYILYSFLMLPVITYIPSLAISSVSDIDITTTILVFFGICIIYTTIGGLKSVVWVDAIQTSIILGGVTAILILGTVSEGGISNIMTKAINSSRLDILDFDLDPTKRDSFWITVFGTASLWLCEISIGQCNSQKCTAVPTFRKCILVVICFGIGISFFKIANTYIGLLAYAKYSGCDPLSTGEINKLDQLIPFYITSIVKNFPGLPGLVFAGALTASMSSVSTILNAMGTIIYKDVVRKFWSKTNFRVDDLTLIKIIVILSGVIVISLVFLVEKLEGMFQLAQSLPSVAFGPLFGIFTVGVLCPMANSKGAFYGGVGGMILASSMVFPAKYYQTYGLFSYPSKPMSTATCNASLFWKRPYHANLSNTDLNSSLPLSHSDFQKFYHDGSSNNTASFQPFPIFRISFYYYSLIGIIITIIMCLVISYITREEEHRVDDRLLTPMCRSKRSKKSGRGDYQTVATNSNSTKI